MSKEVKRSSQLVYLHRKEGEILGQGGIQKETSDSKQTERVIQKRGTKISSRRYLETYLKT